MAPIVVVKGPEILGYHATVAVRHPVRGVLKVERTLGDYRSDDEVIGEMGLELKVGTVGGVFEALEAGQVCSGVKPGSVVVDNKVSSSGQPLAVRGWDEPI